MTRYVAADSAEDQNSGRHADTACPPSQNEPNSTSTVGPDAGPPLDHHPRCKKKKKHKKKVNNCDGEAANSDLCHKRRIVTNGHKVQTGVKQCDNDNSEECQRVETTKKKQETKNYDTHVLGNSFKKKKNKKHIKKRLRLHANAKAVENTTDETNLADEDYAVDATTAWDWEDSTVTPHTLEDHSLS